MSIKILIPTPLRVYAGGQDTVAVEAGTVGEVMAQLTILHPELKKHLYSEGGKLRSFVNVYLNDEDIRYLPESEATPVTPADVLSIIPSIAGGWGCPRSCAGGSGRALRCGRAQPPRTN
ncbi:MAG TPA: MoaD/ThiS family protein [Acidisarcina sp.]